MSIKTAILLAGGLGTRLKPLTDNLPKPLLPIKGKPIIEHVINNFKKHGITDIILSVGYKADKIMDYFGNGEKLGINISYCVEEEPLGTGGAIKKAAQHLNEPFFLAWADNLTDISFSEFSQSLPQENLSVIMTLTPREDVENFGVAKLEDNKIISFIEKPAREDAPSNLINAGVFIVHPKILNTLPQGKSSIEKDCFEKLAPQGKINAYIHKGQWFPTDTIEKYTRANEEFKP